MAAASGDESVQMQFLYWGIAPLIALGAATWKAAGMRGSQHENWSTRVTILKAGLDEHAIQELESLRESKGTLFRPGLPTYDVDRGAASDRIYKFLIGPYKSYRFQDKMPKNIQYVNLTPD